MHHYSITVRWTGNTGTGTSAYKAYSRNHIISSELKSATILGSSDPAFRGDPSRYNPEETFLSAISSCHMLWFLHLCSVNDVVVVDYVDHATAIMMENEDGSGYFHEATLHPLVSVAETSMIEKAQSLHEAANKMCFIANSLNFKVHHVPETKVAQDGSLDVGRTGIPED